MTAALSPHALAITPAAFAAKLARVVALAESRAKALPKSAGTGHGGGGAAHGGNPNHDALGHFASQGHAGHAAPHEGRSPRQALRSGLHADARDLRGRHRRERQRMADRHAYELDRASSRKRATERHATETGELTARHLAERRELGRKYRAEHAKLAAGHRDAARREAARPDHVPPHEAAGPPQGLAAARQRQHEANARAAQHDPHYAARLKGNPDLIPPGPIQDRIDKYHVGDAKVEGIKAIHEKWDAHAKKLDGQIEPLRAEMRASWQKRMQLSSRKNQTRQVLAERARLQASEDELMKQTTALFQEKGRIRAQRAVDIAEYLAVDRPTKFTARDGEPGLVRERGHRSVAPSGELRGRIEEAHAWLGKITRHGDGGAETTEITYAVLPDQRAYCDGRWGHIALAPSDGHDVIIHEVGHAIEFRHGIDNRALTSQGKEFLRYRTGDEAPVDIGEKFNRPSQEGEIGCKDEFDKVFGEHDAYYAGKHYDNATELVAMGVQKLYNDPVAMTRDKQYCKYVLGVLDGSLR